MGWQEEELEKRRRLQKDQEDWAEMRRQTAVTQSTKIVSFWEKLIRANNELPTELRMNVAHQNAEEVLGKYPKGIKLISEKTKIVTLATNLRDNPCPIFEILFSLETGSFYAIRDNDWKIDKFGISEASIDIILRNLCTGRDIWTGLPMEPLSAKAGRGSTTECKEEFSFWGMIKKKFK